MFVSRDLPTSTYITLSLQWENTTMWSRFREVVKIPFLLMRLVVTGKAQFGEFTMPATLGKSEPLDNADTLMDENNAIKAELDKIPKETDA